MGTSGSLGPHGRVRSHRTARLRPRRLAGLGAVAGSLVCMTGLAGPELTWLWANPQPHGNNIYDLSCENGLAVQVGDRGRAYWSLDGNLWVPSETSTTKALRAIAYFKDQLLISGEAGIVLRASRQLPQRFQAVDLATSDWLEGLAASADCVVAVGDHAAIYRSADGTNWSRQSTTFDHWLRSVTYLPKTGSVAAKFVAVGEGGAVTTSPDGVVWDFREVSGGPALNKVIWTGSTLLAVGDGGKAYSSTSGRTWTAFEPGLGITADLYTAAVGGGRLLVGGTSSLRVLAGNTWIDQTDPALAGPAPTWTYYASFWDGLLFVVGGRTGLWIEGTPTTTSAGCYWAEPAPALRPWLWDLTEALGRQIAVGDWGTIMTSGDGAAWDLELTPASVTNAVWLGVGGRHDFAVVVGTQGSLAYSSNGVVWTSVEPRPTSEDLQGIAWSGHEFLATGGDGVILASSDGQRWTVRARVASPFLSGIASGPAGWVAVGEGGSIFTSPDGSSWQPQASGTAAWIYRIRYLQNQFVAVGENGTILTSPNGKDWTARSSGTARWLNDVGWFNGWYYAVGTQGTVLASRNTVDWLSVPGVTQKSLYAMLTTPHQAIIAGVEGILLRAQAGPLVFWDYRRSAGTNTFQLSGTPGHSFQLQSSVDCAGWESGPVLEFLDNTGTVILEQADSVRPPSPGRVFRGRMLP